MPKDIDEVKFMRRAFLPVLPLVYDDALSYIEFLGKVRDKINEVIASIDQVEANILEEAEAYTDSKLAGIESDFGTLQENVDKAIDGIRDDNELFEIRVTEEVNRLINSVNNFYTVLNNIAAAINQRTDMVIQENNNMLLTEMQRYLSNILVMNYITGDQMSIQDMFNYLCMFHLTDPITYTELYVTSTTYTALVALNMTYTDLVTRGGAIIT